MVFLFLLKYYFFFITHKIIDFRGCKAWSNPLSSIKLNVLKKQAVGTVLANRTVNLWKAYECKDR